MSGEPILGSIGIFAGNFAPRGWHFCHGQLLPISQYEALFSLIGTIYGGDGRTSFGLPDLRGRSIIGAGDGPGLSHIQLGQRGGRETIQIETNNADVNTKDADGQVNSFRNAQQSIDNRDPFLAMNYVICASGLFPRRD